MEEKKQELAANRPKLLTRPIYFTFTLGFITCIVCFQAKHILFPHWNTFFFCADQSPWKWALGTDSLPGENHQASLTVNCSDGCVFSLVESIPQNLTFNSSYYKHISTYNALKTLISSANESLLIASYYWTLRGDDIAYYDNTSKEGEDIFSMLKSLGMSKKVSIRVVQNAKNSDTDLLEEQAHVQVRTLNFTELLGAGVLHTKFWVVDGKHFYIGSANLDWRSLTQVKELGVLAQNCSCLGEDVENLFEVYWYLGVPGAKVPEKWPANFSTLINYHNPARISYNNNSLANVYMSSSPAKLCPVGRTMDIDAILYVIYAAQEFIDIAVMDYFPSTIYNSPNQKYWPVIDDALRSVAFDRKVSVRLMVSQWNHTISDMFVYLCSLDELRFASSPKTNISVKQFIVPIYTESQAEIPFARVNHNKYMVTDKHAYIGQEHSDMTKVGVALFGVGRIGQIHLPSLVANPDVNIRWLVDVAEVRVKADELCKKYGIHDARFALADQCQEVFDDPNTQAVVIGTPARTHEDLIKKAVKSGKDVFCEKPIALAPEVVKSCYEEAKNYGRVLFCGFNKRFDLDHIKIRERLQSGELGSPRILHYIARDPVQPMAYLQSSGGIYCDSTIHQLDYIPWLLGEKPCSMVVTGSCTSDTPGDFKAVDDVDTTVTNLQFPSGVTVILENTRNLPTDFCYQRIEIVGTKGTYLVHKLSEDTFATVAVDGSKKEERSEPTFWSSYKREIDCFVRVVQGKEECPLSASEIIQASILADLCLTSRKENRIVTV